MIASRTVLLVAIASLAIVGSLLAQKKLPQVLAHRGASGSAPETTLASYRLALEMKVDFLELDVQMSRDGEIVAIHDPLVDRTTNGKGAVGEMTLAQMRALDAGAWFNRTFPERARPEFAGEHIPTLEEIIRLAAPSRAGLYIETKNPELYPVEFEAKVVDLVRRSGFADRVVIQSFNALSIEKVKKLAPEIPTALLVGTLQKEPVEATLKAGSRELAIDYRLLTAEIADRARAKGLTLTVWTVDDEAEMRRMMALGVDRIITNFPERLNRLVGR
jgi:glycerophosphoryl diester phosphodiesterase